MTTEKKVFVIHVDELEQPTRVEDPEPKPPGVYGTQDLIPVQVPPGYTHVQTVYENHPGTECPVNKEFMEKGGPWLCIRPSVMKIISDNPQDYTLVEGMPFPVAESK